MDWMPLLSTTVGAVIALSGALLVDVRRGRQQRDHDRELDRWRNCVDFALAMDTAHGLLREVARSEMPAEERLAAVARALGESELYEARERLLISAAPVVVTAGERAFQKLIEIRNVVRSGATLQSPAFHDAYHDFADALWGFRTTIRVHFGHRPLVPETLDRTTWSERDRCARCRAAAGLPAID